MQPYEWEVSSEALAAELGLPVGEILRFDTNTSPYAPAIDPALISAALATINEYPDATYAPLVRAIAAYTGFAPDSIVVGAGGDELLDMLAKVYLDSGDVAVTTAPTYSMYGVVTALMGARLVTIEDRPDFGLDLPALIAAARAAKLVWLCHPNNPTGAPRPLEAIAELARAVRCPIVVDEAYIEFHGATATTLVRQHENVIVLRTLSKAFGMAGARVGYALAAPAVARWLNRVRPPNSIGSLSVALATAALQDLPRLRQNVAAILTNREALAADLQGLGLRVLPSATNFLLAEVPQARAVAQALLRRGIVVRDVSSRPLIAGCLRFTVRTLEDHGRLVAALRALLP
jgi:histidinol-phosphate aminotransferase